MDLIFFLFFQLLIFSRTMSMISRLSIINIQCGGETSCALDFFLYQWGGILSSVLFEQPQYEFGAEVRNRNL
jgi:hypothetical protein